MAAWVSGDGAGSKRGADGEEQETAGAAAAAEPSNDDDATSGVDAEAVGEPEPEPVAMSGADADADGGLKSGVEAAVDGGPEPLAKSGADAATDGALKSGADAEADVEPEPVAKSGADAKSDGEPKPGAEAAADGGAEPEPDAKSGAEAGSGPHADVESKSGADSGADAEGAGGTNGSGGDQATAVFRAVQRSSVGRSSVDAGPGGEAGAKSVGDGEKAPGTKGDAKPGAEAESGAKANVESKSGADKKADAKADAEPKPNEPEPDVKSDVKGDGAKDAGGTSGAGVDQATAVFRAVKPPVVDQPTTMLKIGDKARADKVDGDKAGPGGKPAVEADAERTSKFVALKPLDEPGSPRKPAPGAKGAPAAPGTPAQPNPQAEPKGYVGPEKTTQQPLPPKPPLDLLAELTNTPPPPETPLRTAVRRVKIWTPLALLLVVVFAVVQAVRPLPTPTLSLTADDTFVFDGGKPAMPWPGAGQAAMEVDGIGTFGSSGDQKPVPIASVAKVMTAYIILRDHPVKSGSDGPLITMDQKAEDDAKLVSSGESTVDVSTGQKLTEREAIQAIMIASANNIARRLARWDAGSEKAFVEKMNATAKELGMTNTTYTDPSGLTASTVSTALDQVKLGKKAMENQLFREVVRMPSYKDINGKDQQNWNRLVPVNNVIGIKTGTTTKAGGNLMFAARKDVGGTTQIVIGAVLAQPPAARDNSILTGALDAGDKLMRAAQAVLESNTVVKKGDVVGAVDDGLGGTTPVVATKDVSAVGWAGLTVKLKLGDGGKTLPHTAKAGTEVGVLSVGDGTGGAVEVPVALQKDLPEPAFGAKLTRLG